MAAFEDNLCARQAPYQSFYKLSCLNSDSLFKGRGCYCLMQMSTRGSESWRHQLSGLEAEHRTPVLEL